MGVLGLELRGTPEMKAEELGMVELWRGALLDSGSF